MSGLPLLSLDEVRRLRAADPNAFEQLVDERGLVWVAVDSDPPLCASCAHAGTQSARIDGDYYWRERCGAGVRAAERAHRMCFSYEGECAQLRLKSEDRPAPAETRWQDRSVDGMTVRKPK